LRSICLQSVERSVGFKREFAAISTGRAGIVETARYAREVSGRPDHPDIDFLLMYISIPQRYESKANRKSVLAIIG
jgi:hypothetical protein